MHGTQQNSKPNQTDTDTREALLDYALVRTLDHRNWRSQVTMMHSAQGLYIATLNDS